MGDALFERGRRVTELRVETRGEAAERAVAPRASWVDIVGDAEEERRLVEEDGFPFVAMTGTRSDGRDYLVIKQSAIQAQIVKNRD